MEEQKRIAAILDKADELRRLRRRAIDRLDTLAQSIFYDMFGDPARSSDWPTVPVGEVTDCIVPGRDKPKSFSGTIPWITTGEISHLGVTFGSSAKLGLTNSEIEQVRARIVPANSVLMVCVGDLGSVSIAETAMVINQQLHAFLCGEKITAAYLMYALSHQEAYMRSRATKTTLPYMNKSVCNSIPVPVPPLDLQHQFSDLFARISDRRTLLRSELLQRDLFASLQQRAFRGEL